jgi:hypothetical protein
MKYYDKNNMTQRLVNNHRPMQPLNGRQVLANFGAIPITPTPTDGASRVSENHFMFLASLSLILLSFLEI